LAAYKCHSDRGRVADWPHHPAAEKTPTCHPVWLISGENGWLCSRNAAESYKWRVVIVISCGRRRRNHRRIHKCQYVGLTMTTGDTGLGGVAWRRLRLP